MYYIYVYMCIYMYIHVYTRTHTCIYASCVCVSIYWTLPECTTCTPLLQIQWKYFQNKKYACLCTCVCVCVESAE